MSQRFGRRLRLRSAADFTAVRERGRRVTTRHLTVLALPNALESDRLGVIASRRFGGAVARNFAKRRLRELFRTSEPDQAHVRGERPLDIVIIPRRELIDAPFAVLRTELTAAIGRLRGR